MERARETVHRTPAATWSLVQRRPSARVRPYLRDLCGYAEATDGPTRRTEYASLGVVLILDFGELRIVDDQQVTHHPGGFVAGVGDRFAITEHDGRSEGIQINLSPLAARRILGIPMGEITNRIVTFDDLLGPADRGLCERIVDARGWDERFDLVEAFVAARVARTPDVPSVVAWALDRIERSGGTIDIGSLSKATGYSQKHLIDQFRDHVGLPPKRVARLVRFDRVVRYLKSGGKGDWGEIAHRFGYFDQSHLNREVRHFTGGTPTEARKAVAEVGDIFEPR